MRVVNILILSLWLIACDSEPQNGLVNWQLRGFLKADSINPILEPNEQSTFFCPYSGKTVQWESRNVLNPAAVVHEGKVFLLYRAQDSAMTSRIGLAESTDGLHFRRMPEPVFFPEPGKYDSLEWPGGVEDPRIVRLDEGRFLLTYTSYDGDKARLCLATSSDLKTWQRHGPVLRNMDIWSKSGAVVCRSDGESMIAAKIDGKYWMYFGDTDIFMASSEDGITWTPATNEENGNLISVLSPRPGYFDSRLVEPGPFALLTDNGIVLIYNASNALSFSDPDLPVFSYAAGQALFDKEKPWLLRDRSDSYFIHPEKPYEISGEVNQVCFVEGLVYFRNKWYMYYGTADSRIAVAVSESAPL